MALASILCSAWVLACWPGLKRPPEQGGSGCRVSIPPLRRFTMKVMGRWSVETVDVRADGTGLCSRAGTALLALVADRVGLTGGLCDALGHARAARGARTRPGGLRLGGDARRRRSVRVGSRGAGWPVLAVRGCRVGLDGAAGGALDRRCRARRDPRGQGGCPRAGVAAGAAPDRVILDFDATPIDVHSEKEQAAGHYKGGFGFNPLLVSCGREVLGGILRPATLARTTPRITSCCWISRSSNCPKARSMGRSSRVRIRRARATISPTRAARPASGSRSAIRSPSRSVKRSELRDGIGVAAGADHDGEPRDGAWVTELTGKVNVPDWPEAPG